MTNKYLSKSTEAVHLEILFLNLNHVPNKKKSLLELTQCLWVGIQMATFSVIHIYNYVCHKQKQNKGTLNKNMDREYQGLECVCRNLSIRKKLYKIH